jgi:hypothetical protein
MKKLAQLLEIAARKQNESAEAACAIADCLSESDELVGNDLLDSIFAEISGLALLSTEKKPDYERAARKLLAKARSCRRKNA